MLTIKANSRGTSGVSDDVGADLRVGDRTDSEEGAGKQEASAIAGVGIVGAKKHAEADNDEGSGRDEEDLATVEAPAEQWQHEGEETANNIRRHGVQLLHNGGLIGVNSANDGRGEEGQTLDGDVVQTVADGSSPYDRARDATEQLLPVHLVQNLSCADTLRLDAGDGEVLLFLGEPASGFRAVGEGEEAERVNMDTGYPQIG
mgnify:CR=1 FL=1